MNYKVGDLVLAPRTYDYDGPHWEWCTGLNMPTEHAIITEVKKDEFLNDRYYVKFINGEIAYFHGEELKIVAFA